MRYGWHTLEPGVEFVPNWGVYAICDHLEAVTNGDIRRLVITVPPGTTKSMTTGVFWPAWEWGPRNLPHYRYLAGAHKVSLAERDSKRSRDLINSEWYQNYWGEKFAWKRDQSAKVNYQNSKTGWRIATSAASMTGERGDRVLLDDPHTVEGAESEVQRETTLRTFAETVPTRLNKQGESAIVVIMQRIHERDVTGLILAKELGYVHLMLPMEFESERRCYSVVPPSYMPAVKETVYYNKEEHAWTPNPIPGARCEERYNVDKRIKDGELLDPIRFPREAVEELKEALRSWGGTYAEVGQLQQRPAPRGGGMFKKKDFVIIDSLDELEGVKSKPVRGWDLACSTAKTSPFTSGVKMLKIGKKIVVMDSNTFRKLPGAMEAEVKATAERDGKQVTQDLPQDPGQAGKTQKAAMAGLLHGFDVKFSPESGDKELRATPFAAQVEAGNVYVLRAEWNDAYLTEASLFPNGQFKDQIDASSRAYSALIRKRTQRVGGAPQVIEG